jgi:hypothetical protein
MASLVMLTDNLVDDFRVMGVLLTLSDTLVAVARQSDGIPPLPHPTSLDKMARRPSWRNGIWV